MTILTVFLLLQNANVPQLMIDNNFQNDPNFEYQLITGDSLKYAVCFGRPSYLVGATRSANLLFFT
jgi:phospholipase/lecithinase/hemolysin